MLIAAALCGILCIYAPSVWHEYQAPKAYCLALAVFVGFLTLPPVHVAGGLPGLLLADLVWTGLSLVRSSYADRAAIFHHALLIGWAFLISGHGDPVYISYALLVASGMIALIALAEFAGYGLGAKHLQEFGRLAFGRIQGRRPAGPLGNPDLVGTFSAAMLPLSFALLYPFSAALSLLALILSQARAAWLAAGLPGLPLISSYLWISLKEILADRSVQDRFRFYRCAWSLICESPMLGHGAGAFKSLSQRTFQRPRLAHVHSEWLELWVELGAIGLTLRLTIVGLAIWRLLQGDRLAIAFGLSLVVLCVDGLFSLSLRTIGVQLVFWTMLGTSMRGSASGAYFDGAWNLALFAIPNASLLYLMADRNFKKGASLLLDKHVDGLKYLLKAITCDPYHRDARYALALGCLEAGQERAAQAQMTKLGKIDPYYLQEGDGNL